LTRENADRRAENPARDPLSFRPARTEITERKAESLSRNQEVTERKAKDIDRIRRMIAIDEMLAERKADRERGGGRTRER
jgi:hypothetical protein